MIPKIIHYCWFGGAPLNEETRRFIDGWCRLCPDYEIVRWDEKSFDIHCNSYVEEAYQQHKWAFVSDYARLYALNTRGGIYMDTDVELLKNPDPFLGNHGFFGFEKEDAVSTAIIAAEKDLPCIADLLHGYDNRHFVQSDGTLDMHTNVVDITRYFTARGLLLNNELQNIDGMMFYPMDYFCPMDNRTYELHTTENTCAIHHFTGTWIDDKTKLRNRRIKKLLGPKLTAKIVALRKKLGISGD